MKIIELILGDGVFSGIEAISLVEAPAIEEDFIALKSQEVKLAEVSSEKRILLGALLVPNKPIYRKNGEDDYYIYFSKNTIEKASQLYLMNGNQNNATLEHQHTLNGLTLVESWLVEDEVHDKSRKYGLNVPVGTWMGAVKVNSEEVWEEFVKTGKVKGFSIEGYFADKAERPKEPINDMEMKAEQQLSVIRKIIKEGERVELALIDDFETEFKKVIDKDLKIGTTLISALGKAENKYKAIINEYQSVIKMGEQAEAAAKELGIDLPNTFKNRIASSKEGIKEAQKIIGKVNQLYSLF
tara:strand:+ start:624 stop:1517 length:894 start_codon:yes stop_codon:yes gene_type:complete